MTTATSTTTIPPEFNLTDAEIEALGCPEETEAGLKMEALSAYYVEGVALVAVAAMGIVGNTISGLILVRKSMRNSFNLLLVALAVYDNTYLVGIDCIVYILTSRSVKLYSCSFSGYCRQWNSCSFLEYKSAITTGITV